MFEPRILSSPALEPTKGLEPPARGLQNRCSAIELRRPGLEPTRRTKQRRSPATRLGASGTATVFYQMQAGGSNDLEHPIKRGGGHAARPRGLLSQRRPMGNRQVTRLCDGGPETPHQLLVLLSDLYGQSVAELFEKGALVFSFPEPLVPVYR